MEVNVHLNTVSIFKDVEIFLKTDRASYVMSIDDAKRLKYKLETAILSAIDIENGLKEMSESKASSSIVKVDKL
jgi:hypothetical protein